MVERLKEHLKQNPEAMEKLKNYTYRGKKQFRLDFSQYITIKVNWVEDVWADLLKKWIKSTQEELNGKR